MIATHYCLGKRIHYSKELQTSSERAQVFASEQETEGCTVDAYFNSDIKVVPSQAWTGPEGSEDLRLPDFKTVDT
jgi:hypothetical protein